MKTRIVLIAAALVAVLAVGAGCAPHHHSDAQELASKAESGLYMTGTLAALGSFEWDAAPLQNEAAVKLHLAAVALKEGRMSVGDAQALMDDVDRAHDLITAAITACAQNSVTAKCTKDEARGRDLLDQARAALSAIPDVQ